MRSGYLKFDALDHESATAFTNYEGQIASVHARSIHYDQTMLFFERFIQENGEIHGTAFYKIIVVLIVWFKIT